MKKHEEYEGQVVRLKFPNKGIVEVEGEEATVQVKNVLPGQKISFVLTKNREKKKEGNLRLVLEPADIETETPPCPHFADCGGCAYQTLTFEAQKELKLNQVKTLLNQVYPDFPLQECVNGEKIWEYRNKMEFSFGDDVKDGPLCLGLHKRGSFYDIVNVEECKIVDESIRNVLIQTHEFFLEKKTSFYKKRSHEGFLRHLLVRRSEHTGEILVALVTSSQGDHEKEVEDWKNRLLDKLGENQFSGILHIYNDSLADVVKSDETRILYGKDYFMEEILGLTFKITPFSFFQTNTKGSEVLYSIARDYIGEIDNKVVYDLYSGTGTIAQIMASVAKKVIGIEIVEEAVEAAKENASLNGLDNCEFIAGDVLKKLSEVEEKPDFIVLDPPREGVHPKALAQILENGVERMVYISCKPTSLARDLEAILEAGYEPVKAACVDMFSFTRGIETVVLFEKKAR